MAKIGAGMVCCAGVCDFNKIVYLTPPWRRVKAFRPAPTASSPVATRLSAGLRAFWQARSLWPYIKGGQLR
jgi:hypothetical protein